MLKAIIALLIFLSTLVGLFAEGGKGEISITVLGEVQNPGFYQIAPRASMIDGVIVAGGFTRKAKTWEILIISRHGKIATENFRKIRSKVEERHGSLSGSEKIEEMRKLSKILSDGDTIIVAEPSE